VYRRSQEENPAHAESKLNAARTGNRARATFNIIILLLNYNGKAYASGFL
jgi:hypothetical protein